MKKIILLTILVVALPREGMAQWKDFGSWRPAAFGVHDTVFFSSATDGGVLRHGPGIAGAWVIADTGLNGHAVTALASMGMYMYAGCNGGGIFRSSNNGSSWTAIN